MFCYYHNDLCNDAVWLSAGRSPSGALHQVMCHTRNKYHYAVRKVKRMGGAIKSSHLLEAAEQGDQALIKEMKNTLDKKQQGQAVPETLDGKVTHDTILHVLIFIQVRLQID